EALDPRPGQRDRLAEEEEAVIAVLLDAEERACVEAEQRLRQAPVASSSAASGSIAASIASSCSESRPRRRSASQAVRLDLTDRRTRCPADVTCRPTRRLSPPTAWRSTSPAASSRATNFEIAGTEIRSRAASSRIPI